MKVLPLVALFLLFAFTPAKAVDYVFVDYTIAPKTLTIISAAPNAQYTYVVSQLSGTGATQFALSGSGPFASTQQLVINTDGSGTGSAPYWVKGTSVGTSKHTFLWPRWNGLYRS